MKNQIIQNVFKLMLGTSALLVSIAFLIRSIEPIHANSSSSVPDLYYNGLQCTSPTETENNAVSNETWVWPRVVGCGGSIYMVDYTGQDIFGIDRYKFTLIGPN